MTGWREKQKGKTSSKREREEGKEGQRRDKEGPVRPNKDGLYTGEGQMGVLFMVSSYTLREAPSGHFKEEMCVHVCACAPDSSAHLGQPSIPKYLHISARHDNMPHRRLGVCTSVLSFL